MAARTIRRVASARLGQRALMLLIGVLVSYPPSPSLAKQTVRQIADTFAGSAVENGLAVGVGVAIVTGGKPPRFFSYGLADADHGVRFSPDSIFQIGSVTKVFTTNLLGQAASVYPPLLDLTLSSFGAQLGSLMPLTGQVTLKQLGDFTAGLPSTAPLCRTQNVPGCLPSGRPTITEYGAQDFLAYFQNTTPANYNLPQPQPVSSLPAPYFYSDFSTGLLGLLIGAGGGPITDSALDGWLAAVSRNLLDPLGMDSTYLAVPAHRTRRIASGYELPLARATVQNGQVASIEVVSSGGNYGFVPEVTVTGGGGTGATATASFESRGGVGAITVTNGGTGYVAPPVITFNGAGATKIAEATAVVSNGRLVGIQLLSGGSGYDRVPRVTITGGRRPGIGRDAVASAHIANGQVSFVSVTDGGKGYERPIAVLIAPGEPVNLAIPIWAPAGSLSSTLRDMAKFASAALGRTRVEGVGRVDPAITAGFRVAETPYACQGTQPDLANCPQGPQSGLAWAINPADPVNGVPAIIAKNGGIAGFSTQVELMPERDTAVVVFANARSGGTGTGEDAKVLALLIARNILHALFYDRQD